jgi:hypothetical protein
MKVVFRNKMRCFCREIRGFGRTLIFRQSWWLVFIIHLSQASVCLWEHSGGCDNCEKTAR